jgi:creatinine amidohydrolase/Fe(II)-dependent formamide hydrolase-like protein
MFMTALDLTKDKAQELNDISLTWPYVGDHAAEWETSLMLYFYPELVHMENAPESIELDMEGLPDHIRKRYPRRASREYGWKLHSGMIKCGVDQVKKFLIHLQQLFDSYINLGNQIKD